MRGAAAREEKKIVINNHNNNIVRSIEYLCRTFHFALFRQSIFPEEDDGHTTMKRVVSTSGEEWGSELWNAFRWNGNTMKSFCVTEIALVYLISSKWTGTEAFGCCRNNYRTTWRLSHDRSYAIHSVRLPHTHSSKIIHSGSFVCDFVRVNVHVWTHRHCNHKSLNHVSRCSINFFQFYLTFVHWTS